MYWDKLLNPERFRNSFTYPRSKNDNRSPFKRDFDTVCNSTILRRLQAKAQVFPLEQEDYARTRLTHSIEAMSIAESLGFEVVNIIKQKGTFLSENKSKNFEDIKHLDQIPYILKTAALLHDMGNPPFGHLGEQIICDWFKENLKNFVFNSDKKLVYNPSGETKQSLEYILKGAYSEDLKHFDGNAQLFRLVNKLCLIVDEYGMNLTFPVMATFIKYPTDSLHIKNDGSLIQKKPGYYTSEKQQFNCIKDKLGLSCKSGNCRHPLAYLLEAADDIAYLTADIDDAHRKKLLSLDMLVKYLKDFSKDKNDKDDELISKILEQINKYKHEAKLMKYEDENNYVLHRTRVLIKGLMINSINDAFESSYELIMSGEFNDELINISSAKQIASALREIESKHIHYSPNILESKTRAIAIITKLLDMYVPAIVNWSKDIDYGKDSSNNLLYLSLSNNYKYICECANRDLESSNEQDFEKIIYNKILLVTDQLSGMTDTHALSVYKKIIAN